MSAEPNLPGETEAANKPTSSQPRGEFQAKRGMLKVRESIYSTLELSDDLLHTLVAFVLVVLAILFAIHILMTDFPLIFHSLGFGSLGADLTEALPKNDKGESIPYPVSEAVLTGINDVLFVMIILEILRTVTAHLKEQTFALRPFIIIGIISAVRHLLIIGARMSATEEKPTSVAGAAVGQLIFDQHIKELALNGMLTIVLVISFWLLAKIKD